jgi:hypothetical protein
MTAALICAAFSPVILVLLLALSADALARDLSTGRIPKLDVEGRLKSIIAGDSDLYAVSVAYIPFAFNASHIRTYAGDYSYILLELHHMIHSVILALAPVAVLFTPLIGSQVIGEAAAGFADQIP